MLSWISRNTLIPVPTVIRYDSSTENPLAYEYMLLSKAPGECLTDIYDELGREQMTQVIDQLVDVLAQLHQWGWKHIGGLCFTNSDEIIPGPVLEETFWQVCALGHDRRDFLTESWQVPDIRRYWVEETVESLNISGPFDSYVAYISAHVHKYMHAITQHHSLAFMRDVLPQLKAFLDTLEKCAAELNCVKLRLAHKDLHFGNIMYDRSSGKITAILD